MKKKIIASAAVVAILAGIAVFPVNSAMHRKANNEAKEAVVQTAAVKEEVAAPEITEIAEEETAAPAAKVAQTKEVKQSTTATETTTVEEKTTVAEKATRAAETVATTVVEKLGKKTESKTSSAAGKNSSDALGLGNNSSDCLCLFCRKKSSPYKIKESKIPWKSELVEGFECVKSWKTNSNGSQVTVEKIDVTDRVKGRLSEEEKIGTASNYYAYIAKVTTTPDKVQMRDSSITFHEKPGYFEAPVVKIAQETGALIAVNNEMCVHNRYNEYVYLHGVEGVGNATVIKNRELVNDDNVVPTPSLLWYEDGTWEFHSLYNEAEHKIVSKENYQEWRAKGVTNTVAYTYPVIWKGEKYKLEETGDISNIWRDYAVWHEVDSKNHFDHTLVGKIDSNNYVFGITEGFGQAYLWDIFYDSMNVQDGFWCNGGHCSVLYLKGCGAVNGGSNESSVSRHSDPTPCITADIIGVY